MVLDHCSGSAGSGSKLCHQKTDSYRYHTGIPDCTGMVVDDLETEIVNVYYTDTLRRHLQLSYYFFAVGGLMIIMTINNS